MRYRAAQKLHSKDKVVLKKTCEILTITKVETQPQNKTVLITCSNGIVYHHTELK